MLILYTMTFIILDFPCMVIIPGLEFPIHRGETRVIYAVAFRSFILLVFLCVAGTLINNMKKYHHHEYMEHRENLFFQIFMQFFL
jgi:hypothetical protein